MIKAERIFWAVFAGGVAVLVVMYGHALMEGW